MDDHPYLLGYLIGCAVAFFLGIFVVLEGYIVAWIFKGNVLRSNLNKIQDPSTQGFKADATLLVVGLLSGIVMSWLGVLQYLWRVFSIPLNAIRETLSSVPEQVKSLRYPLLNNPNLSRESVWAYAYALGVRTGARADAAQMRYELEEVGSYYPSFESEAALETLRSLGVISEQTISEAMALVRVSKEDDGEELNS